MKEDHKELIENLRGENRALYPTYYDEFNDTTIYDIENRYRCPEKLLCELYMYLLEYRYYREHQTQYTLNKIRDRVFVLNMLLKHFSVDRIDHLDIQTKLYKVAREYAVAFTGNKSIPEELAYNLKDITDIKWVENYIKDYRGRLFDERLLQDMVFRYRSVRIHEEV